MKININHEKNNNLNENEIEITIHSASANKDIDKTIIELINYIKSFENQIISKVLVNYNNTIIALQYNEIFYFYSDKKYNYCKTQNNTYKIKSKLYEIEKMHSDFIRISKNCIANIQHIQCFDISETGRIIIYFKDGHQEFVSRRKLKNIMSFLEERSI